jgi:hypothetical protein
MHRNISQSLEADCLGPHLELQELEQPLLELLLACSWRGTVGYQERCSGARVKARSRCCRSSLALRVGGANLKRQTCRIRKQWN